jgi:hypothetical protein
MAIGAYVLKGAVPVGHLDAKPVSNDQHFSPTYIPKFTTVEEYIEARAEILRDDFGIRLTDWDMIRLKKCKNELQVNNTIHTIINEHWR